MLQVYVQFGAFCPTFPCGYALYKPSAWKWGQRAGLPQTCKLLYTFECDWRNPTKGFEQEHLLICMPKDKERDGTRDQKMGPCLTGQQKGNEVSELIYLVELAGKEANKHMLVNVKVGEPKQSKSSNFRFLNSSSFFVVGSQLVQVY